jgi:hypothetical protein
MVKRIDNPDFIKNPLTNEQSYIKKGSKTFIQVQKLLQKYKGNIQRARTEYIKLTSTPKPKYKSIDQNDFCGEICHYKPKSFPVNTEKRCRAALSYARYATDPECIRRCALKKAKENGWKCGTVNAKI